MPLSADGDAAEYVPYKRDHDSDYDEEQSSSDGSCDDTDPLEEEQFNFNALQLEISEAIKQLGGCVFPKLDWSSPRDACWISTYGVPKCQTCSEVFLLLKSSDFINHDLDIAKRFSKADGAEYQHHLVLRRWINDINSGMEFRCIIVDNRLFGISQRDIRTFYEYLPAQVDSLSRMISEFWTSKVSQNFTEKCYTMDIYLDQSRNKVTIIDFNPLIPETDLYLFSSDELNPANNHVVEPQFRIIRSKQEAIKYGSNAPIFATSMLPQEAVLMSQGATLDDFARDMQQQMRRQFEKE